MKSKKFYFHKLFLLFALTWSTIAYGQVKLYPSDKNSKEYFWKMYDLGKKYQSSNLQKADSMRLVLLSLCNKHGNYEKFYALIFDADIDKIHGDKDVYFRKILQLQPYQDKLNSPKVNLEINQKLGEYYLNSRDFDQSDFYLKQALKLSKKRRDNKEISETFSMFAMKEIQRNQKDSAMYFVKEAIQFGRRSANKGAMAAAFNTQALVYAYFGQVELSVSKNLIALQLASEVEDLPKMAKYSLDLGEAQLSILNYREAELYFNQVQDVASKLKDKRLIALALVNLGIIYRIDKNYEKATDYQSRALKILTTLNDFDGLGIAHNNLGDIYREQKNYPKALSNYNKALVFFESSGNKESIATVYHNVGIVFEKQGKYANALNYLNRSVEIRSQFGFKGTIYSTYRAISEVYEKTSNYKLAQNYLKLYADYADSAKTIESSAKIAELNELYRSEQRERLISVQADSIERQKQEKTLTSTKLENVQLKNNMQAYIITGFAILLVLAGVIGFYRWNQTKIKQQQQEAEMNQTLLRTQMNPHFVFNAMSVIQSYIYDNDTQNSSRFLVNFSKLMRLILENSSKEFIPMETEVDILDKYLSIQKLRFEERFDFEIKVDQKLLDESAIIPPMITQPFIENAIEHGRLHLREDGFIHVHIFEKNKMLFITIEDNGVGRKGAEQNKKSSDHKSMAMKITSDRIENLNKKYRAEGFMLIEDYNKIEETGTKVLISIPYRVNAQN
jgi:tetratricopeptide (TPR) repeat protein/two-component sensor histidine kinase